MSTNSPDLVTVTGASGFVALHCIAELLAKGYRVRGTLRDLTKQETVYQALGGSPEIRGKLSFVAADLMQDDGWDQAMQGARFVLHTASPLPKRAPRHEDELIIPAREGTLRVLRAAAKAGVSRVVLTSSLAAIQSGLPRTQGRTFTELDFSDPTQPMPAYSKSKTLAEQAAWEFMASLPGPEPMQLVCINPVYVLGPSLDGRDNTSNEVVRKLLAKEMPGVPRLMFSVVDVRDVADAHFRAMLEPAAAGHRFLISTADCWHSEIAQVLRAAGYAVPTREVPNWLVHVVSWLDPTVRLVLPSLGLESHASADKARRVLGWAPRPIEDTLLDTARSIAQR
jgi:nucleoside-diphosphate-sugar epimerase